MDETSRNELEVAVLLADITGSTPLYEGSGDAAALSRIGECLDVLRSVIDRQGGTFIHSKGDDVLCTFPDAVSALKAAREMLAERWTAPLAIHAGLHFGPVIVARGDIFGDAVNLTARLAALANPGEILVSASVVERLPGVEAGALRPLDSILFKGKSAPVRVYSLSNDDAAMLTQAAFGPGLAQIRRQDAAADVAVTLRHADRMYECREGASLTIGRAAECDILIAVPWVSRQHATVSVRGGKAQLSDRSSSGTYVSVRGGAEVFLRRETVLLIGSGTISPAIRAADSEAEVIHYDVDRP